MTKITPDILTAKPEVKAVLDSTPLGEYALALHEDLIETNPRSDFELLCSPVGTKRVRVKDPLELLA